MAFKDFFQVAHPPLHQENGNLIPTPQAILTTNVIPGFQLLMTPEQSPIKRVEGFMYYDTGSGGGGTDPAPDVGMPRRFPYSFIPRR